MSHLINLSGQTIGRLIVIEKVRGPNLRKTYWRCRCACGTEKVVNAQKLRLRTTLSCGCFQRDRVAETFTTHGHTRKRTISREYAVWINMYQRCTNPKHPSFADYGARGINVCESWRKFENFLSDMGERPPDTTLDRIDNDGNYEPTNCRWANVNTQARNRRTSRFIRCNGNLITIAEAAEQTGLSKDTIYMRIHRGWPENEWLIPNTT